MKAHIAEKVVIFKSNINEVWETMTDNTKYKWRTDIDKITILNDTVFVEFTKAGYETKFYITKKLAPNQYEFDMENDTLTGHFTATLEAIEGGNTKGTFIEEVYIRNPIISLLSSLTKNVNKMQDKYIYDLRDELAEQEIIDYNREFSKEYNKKNSDKE